VISNIKFNSLSNINKLIIFDRDGTLIENIPYLKDVTKIKFIPGVVPTLQKLQALGFQMVVATNQSGVGRKLMNENQVESIHNEITKQLHEIGIKLDEYIYCPHTPETLCKCRKPENGMIEQIISQKKVHRSNVVFVGDMLTDAIAASKSSIKSVIISKDPSLLNLLPKNCELVDNFEQIASIVKCEN
jgi:D-glycero-D-manno-heptose 1,7-bisphosphate phosphatase